MLKKPACFLLAGLFNTPDALRTDSKGQRKINVKI
jgi:hypothetical protein